MAGIHTDHDNEPISAYLDSLKLLLERDDQAYWPTHGPCIDDPKPYVEAFIEHRHEREDQILQCIGERVHRISDMVPRIYAEHPEFMYPAAARSVLATIEYLVNSGTLAVDGEVKLDSEYRLA